MPYISSLLAIVHAAMSIGCSIIPGTLRSITRNRVAPSVSFAYFTPDSRDYYVQFDENGAAMVIFGDGVYGRRPPVGVNNIRARYRVGGGAAGNVLAGTIVQAKTSILQLDSVTNPAPAAGGADGENIDHAVRFGPLAFRSGQRAVTLDDFVALAHQAGGVARVRARASSWNEIELYIAPEGDICSQVPEDLRQRLLAYFEDRRMVGTSITIKDPRCVAIDISIQVVVDRRYSAGSVRQSVENAVRNLLAFANVDFGQSLYLSDVYGAVEKITGVVAATITRFRRQDSSTRTLEVELNQLLIPSKVSLLESLQRALSLDIVAGGRVDIGEFEIPTLGDLVVTEVAR